MHERPHPVLEITDAPRGRLPLELLRFAGVCAVVAVAALLLIGAAG